ncbi:MAG: hypothetical protein EP326_07625 [Deltaproteobacteria bacterium]|nr:MAG: hypothetical protein EP326_07625 [Deltaproteobacteria bacterium]TNF30202.1 MAG: hypothetical protein EP319_05740 [Deltaproteobacteria bacterium]
MKKLFKNINKTSLAITLIVHFMAYYAHADSSVGIVSKLEGNAFETINGKTRSLKVGDELTGMSEVMTTSGANITITDYFDHQFHLSGSSHVKMTGIGMELRRGYLWVQSYGKSQSPYSIKTANGFANVGYGETIMSFDPASSKTQLLVMKGTHSFGNLMEPDMTLTVEDGHFSFLSNDVENGIPRQSTPVGFSSFKKVTSLFQGVESMDKGDWNTNNKTAAAPRVETQVARTIASTKQAPVPGTVIYVKSVQGGSRVPASAGSDVSAFDYYKSKVKKAPWKTNLKKSGVPVKVWGETTQRTPASTKSWKQIKREEKPKFPTPPTKVETSSRNPASVSDISIRPVEVKTDDFEKGLSNQYKKQMRHSTEVNSLIRDLQNYDQDFKTAY